MLRKRIKKPKRPIVHHHVEIKRHHKWILGSFTSLIIALMISLSIFTYMIFIKQEINHNVLDRKITDLRENTHSSIYSLSEGLIQTRENIGKIGSQIGIIHEEFSIIKASAGEDFSGIIEELIPSIVTIRTDVGQGTGFIIHEEGYVVTNAHVLTDGRYVDAITYDQEIIRATFIGYDPILDIALLKIPGTYNILELERSSNIQVGENVIAIGNPLGLQFSVSQGIVSSIHRQGPNGINAYIQTDAALNRGNSGGPLINKRGNVIGINNFKVGGSEGLGFALESDFIKQVINEIASENLNQTLIN